MAELPPRTTSGRAAITLSSETIGVNTGTAEKMLLPPHSEITSLMTWRPFTVMSGSCHIS